jgi:hypothetical protein
MAPTTLTILKTLKLNKTYKRYGLVVIAMGYGLDGEGSTPGRGKTSLLHNVQTDSKAHPASCTVGTGTVSPGVKRLGSEADHSPPSSAEVQNGGYTSTAP